MKTFAILFTLFYFLNALAVAPYGFKGQQQSQTLYSNVLQAQNNLVTNMGGINALLETGNKNILINPSFEHATFSTGWTNSAGTFTQDTVVEIDGLKAAKLVLSSQTMSLTQSSTLYASQFADGVQGLASVRVKSDVALKVCSIQAGVVSTTNCVDVQANNKWGLYKVPMILGATSNGISIASSGAVSGTVYIDDAFVGAVDLKVDINNIGNWTNGICSATWTTNTSVSCKYRQVGTDLEVQYLLTLSGAPNSTGLYLNMPSGFTIDTTKIMATTGNPSLFGRGTARDLSTNKYYDVSVNIASSSVIGFFYTINAPVVWASGDTFTASIKIPVTQFSNAGSVYSSTNADTDWASCGHTTSSFTGFGTVTNINTHCKRQGGDLLVKGYFTSGTPTAVEARVSLPIWNGVQLVSAGSSVIPATQLAGDAVYSTQNSTYFRHSVLIDPSVSYFNFGVQSSTLTAMVKALGTQAGSLNNVLSITARIPIEGWQQSNIIIGQFNGLESCATTLDCTDTFSAKISSAGVISEENVDWLSTCSSGGAGFKVCTLKTSLFTVAPNCQMTSGVGSSANFLTRISASSASSVTFLTMNTNATPVDGPFEVICQKQGVDYIGKTAKAVASDQSLRTPGVTNAVINSCKINNNGTATLDSSSGLCSSWISSVSRTSLGSVTINFLANTFLNPPVCTLSTHTVGNAIPQRIQSSTASSVIAVFIVPNTAALVDVDFNITCHGVKP